MTDKVTLYNLIANLLGQDDQMIDPADDTRIAHSITTVWDVARRKVLRANNWNCAETRVALPALDDAPPFEFSAAFELPADIVKLVDVVGPMPLSRDWKRVGRQILANTSGPLQIIYNRDLPDCHDWDDDVVMAFAHYVASLIAVRITGSTELRDEQFKLFKDASGDAQVDDANENPPPQFDPDPWEMARYGWGGGYPG